MNERVRVGLLTSSSSTRKALGVVFTSCIAARPFNVLQRCLKAFSEHGLCLPLHHDEDGNTRRQRQCQQNKSADDVDSVFFEIGKQT